MRGGAVAQLLLGLGEGDVEPRLAGLGALEQELERDRRLAGAGAAFEQIDVPGRKPPARMSSRPATPVRALGEVGAYRSCVRSDLCLMGPEGGGSG